MATTKTRILLRNDTAANWAESTLSLLQGEVAIDSTNGLMRMGKAGGTTWANSLPIGVAPEQISAIIRDYSKEYQIVSVDTNAWKLQVRPLSGGDWADATGSISVDFSAITTAIDALSDAIDDEVTARGNADTYISGQVDGISATLNTVSSDYLKATVFNEISTTIGLNRANANDPVVVSSDIADIAGAMHFRGAVTPNEGETDLEAIARTITDPAPGDVVIITTDSKEFVCSSVDPVTWLELGDENIYATKAEVATVSATLSNDYVDKIATAKSEAINAAKDYTDGVSAALSADYQGKIDGLSGDVGYLSGQISSIANTYATKEYVNGISSALSDDYVGKIDTLSTELTTLVGNVSAETLVSANNYTDTKFAGLSNYYTKTEVNEISTALSTGLIGEPTDLSSADTINGAKTYAKNYTDEQVAALSIDDYIKHGECVQSDLSGYFIFDCGGASLREGEPTSV